VSTRSGLQRRLSQPAGLGSRPGRGLSRLPPIPLGIPGQASRAWARRSGRSLLQRLFGRDSALRHFDYLLLAAVLALSLIGTLLIYSATRPGLVQAGENPRTYLMKQLLNVVLGLIFMVVVTAIDHRRLRRYAPLVYVASCLALLVVLSPLGVTINGAHSWISLPGGFQIEPSEFAKLAIIAMTAMILGRDRLGDFEARPRLRGVALAIGAAAVPVVLVLAEPDLGVVIVLAAILAGMVVLSGLRLRWLAVLGAAAALAVLAVIKLHVLKSYQIGRLTSFLHPTADPTGTGWSALQAKTYIGSGGLFGQGLFHGVLTAGNFLGSEQQSDFIFAVTGEELGFVGAAVIIFLLGVVLLRALRIASRAEDQFGMLLASGIAIWFAVQAFINIGMTVGIMPVTGLPLPFVSYGGSAMFADMIAIGALQSVHRRRVLFRE
jgi:rod shape determining protein RodA